MRKWIMAAAVVALVAAVVYGAGELTNMRALDHVTVDVINIEVARKNFVVSYSIKAADNAVMYRETFEADLSGVPNIGNYTLAQMVTWATGAAVADAEAKYGQ